MNARLKRWLRVVYSALNAASVVAWLFSLGAGAAISAAISGSVAIKEPWRSIVFVGILCAVAALMLPLAAVGVAWLAHVIPSPPREEPTPIPEPPPPVSPPVPRLEPAERERAAKRRVVAHEALTTLESQAAELKRMAQDFNRQYQGMWPEDRALLAESGHWSEAYRAIETAFIKLRQLPDIAMLRVPNQASVIEALQAIEYAKRTTISALNTDPANWG